MSYIKTILPARDPSALSAWLSVFSDKSERLFVLIDVGRVDAIDVLQLPSFTVPGSQAINLYDDLAKPEFSKLGPCLIALSSEPQICHRLLEIALNTQSVAFLWSSESQHTLAVHLRNMREVALADGKPVLFRFQDTKVASALFSVLPISQHDRFLGPLRRWAVVGPCLDLHLLEHLPSNESTATLVFNETTTRALDEALFEHTVEAQIDETDSALLRPLSFCQRHERISHHLQRARAIGLTVSSDLSFYCILAFQLPEGFEKRPPFARALRFRENGLKTFGKALETAAPEEWVVWNDILNR